MRLLFVFCLPLLLFGQTADPDHVELLADKLVHAGSLLRGTGHARATSGDIAISADEATLHSDTGELELHGHVRATLPARPDHSVFRYGTGNLLTDQIVGLTADRLDIKNGLLKASGNVSIVPADPDRPGVRLQGDELVMYLRTADATLRGNVRVFNVPDSSNRFRRPTFPPDVIK